MVSFCCVLGISHESSDSSLGDTIFGSIDTMGHIALLSSQYFTRPYLSYL